MMPIRVAGLACFLPVGRDEFQSKFEPTLSPRDCLTGVWFGANFLLRGQDRELPLASSVFCRMAIHPVVDSFVSTCVGIVEPRILARAGPRSAYINSPRSNEPSASDLRGEP